MIKTYSEMMKLETFEDRFDYLKLWDLPHVPPDDVLYRRFLKTREWKFTRIDIYERDGLQDLAVEGLHILTKVIIHHINPITNDDLINMNMDKLLNPENLITTEINTHNRIHYKPVERMPTLLERSPGDTTLW